METKKCNYCKKTVLAISKVCKHCGKSLEEAIVSTEDTTINQPEHRPVDTHEEIRQTPEYHSFSQPEKNHSKSPKSFPWNILIAGLVLLLGVGGGFGYFKFYLPYKIDREAPRFYTFSNSNTFLRSSQLSGVEDNILAKLPYGTELIVYDYYNYDESDYDGDYSGDGDYTSFNDWSNVKWNNTKGYVASRLIMLKSHFYLLNSIWGDNESKEIINTTRCRKALVDYFLMNGYFGVIDQGLLQSLFDMETVHWGNVYQVFSKKKDSKYNTTYFKRIIDKDSKFNDFAVIIKNPYTKERKCLLFSFYDDETPYLIYEEEAPEQGDIVSIKKSPFDDEILIEYSK